MKRLQSRGGGIINSAKRLHETSEDDLYSQSMIRINEIIPLGPVLLRLKAVMDLTFRMNLKC